MIDVGQLYCPASGLNEGEPGSYHHMVPQSAGKVAGQPAWERECRKCCKTEKQLREEAKGT